MTFIGDLERAFATALYPNRVAIALGLLIVLVVLAVVARRRGWLSAARRHPRRTALLAVALLAIGGPTAWYLGSPLFIRTELTEAAPNLVPSPTASLRPASVAPSAAATDRESVPPASPGSALAATRMGMFQGADEFHFGQGTASLIEVSPSTWTLRFDDFSVRNGPDLYVYLSPDPTGYADGAIEIGTLKATDGAFNTDIPAGTDVSAVRSVVIWCKQFSVQFAVATLD